MRKKGSADYDYFIVGTIIVFAFNNGLSFVSFNFNGCLIFQMAVLSLFPLVCLLERGMKSKVNDMPLA